MEPTQYIIYWMNPNQPECEETTDLGYALKRMEELRNCTGYRGVTLAAENPDRVGVDGADHVKDGKTPDGEDYTWVKRRDGGQ